MGNADSVRFQMAKGVLFSLKPIPQSFRCLILLGCCLALPGLLALPTEAQRAERVTGQSVPIERNPSGVALLNRAAAAMGAQPGRVRSVSARGRRIDLRATDRPDRAFQVLSDGAGRVRWEFESGQGMLVSVVEGNSGFEQRPGVHRALGLNETAGRSVEALPALALGEWISSGDIRVSALEPIQYGDRILERVEVSRSLPGAFNRRRRAIETASRVELSISPESGLPERLIYFLHPGDWRIDVPIELRFDDYRTVGQTLWPFQVTLHRAGAAAVEYVFEEVLLNVPIDDESFAPRRTDARRLK